MRRQLANQELFDILKQGREVWNQWRQDHPEMQRPHLTGIELRGDFTGVNLQGAHLEEASLGHVNLKEANLRGAVLIAADLIGGHLDEADLSWAFLHGANFRMAHLSRANLTGVKLYSTDLQGAHLDNADLNHATLSATHLNWADLNNACLNDAQLNNADLSKAQLSNTDFSGATLAGVIFADVDLHTVKGLESVKHNGPSTIGIDTIYRSGGQIPEIFLRKAGVPEDFITYMYSLVNCPLDYYTCFISYSRLDQDFAERLYANLQSKGVRCWSAPEDLKIGDHYQQRIDESIRLYDKFILILSKYAVQSAWVEREVVAAREKEDCEQRPVLFPIRLDDAVMQTTKAWAADVRRRWHIGNFTQWKHPDVYQIAFECLLRDLKAEQKREE